MKQLLITKIVNLLHLHVGYSLNHEVTKKKLIRLSLSSVVSIYQELELLAMRKEMSRAQIIGPNKNFAEYREIQLKFNEGFEKVSKSIGEPVKALKDIRSMVKLTDSKYLIKKGWILESSLF